MPLQHHMVVGLDVVIACPKHGKEEPIFPTVTKRVSAGRISAGWLLHWGTRQAKLLRTFQNAIFFYLWRNAQSMPLTESLLDSVAVPAWPACLFHNLRDITRHLGQSKPIKNSVDVRNAADIPQCLGRRIIGWPSALWKANRPCVIIFSQQSIFQDTKSCHASSLWGLAWHALLL